MPEGRLQRTREAYADDPVHGSLLLVAQAANRTYADIFDRASQSIGPRGLDLRVRSVGDTLTP